MNKTRIMFFALLGAFGLTAGAITPVFGVEKDTTKAITKSAKVDVNHATQEELQGLPGVGEAYAKKIIEGRPYKNEADLVKSGIPQATVDKLKHKIRFGREKAAKHRKEREAKASTQKETKTTSSTKTETSNVTPQVPPKKGMVWVNTDTMVYHTEGDHWYGNTKNGKFMDEKEAIKFGAHLSKQD